MASFRTVNTRYKPYGISYVPRELYWLCAKPFQEVEVSLLIHGCPHFMVHQEGLEPTHPKALEPKSSASTNFATSALFSLLWYATHTSCQAVALDKRANIGAK